MRYICSHCDEQFSVKGKAPKLCPYCGNENVVVVSKSKDTALKLIAECNALTEQIDDLMDQYAPLYLERECILAKLRAYKYRGVISAADMPKVGRYQIQAKLSDYRKQKGE